jgi:hypothetical protein
MREEGYTDKMNENSNGRITQTLINNTLKTEIKSPHFISFHLEHLACEQILRFVRHNTRSPNSDFQF